jgi:WD40 repeat protein
MWPIVAEIRLPERARQVLFSADLKYLLLTAPARAGEATLLRLADGWQLRVQEQPRRMRESGALGVPVNAAAFAADGRLIATASGTEAHTWDAGSGAQLMTFAAPQLRQPVTELALSSDGRRLATAQGKTAQVWDTDTGQVVATLTHNGQVRGLTFSPDGGRLACAQAMSAQIWDAATGARLGKVSEPGLRGTCFSGDSRHLATAGMMTAHMWDASTGKQWLRVNHAGASAVACSPVDGRFATGAMSTLRLWDTVGRQLVTLQAGSASGGVCGLGFSPDARVLAAAAPEVVRIWQVPG